MAGCKWTSDEDQQIRDLYGTIPNADLAARLDRSRRAVALRGIQLGVACKRDTPEWFAKIAENGGWMPGHRASPATEFKRGNRPWNDL